MGDQPESVVLVLARALIPLDRAALCLSGTCEAVFEMHRDGCPACGGKEWVPLAAFLQSRAERLNNLPHIEDYGWGNPDEG
jgi:hypothetical protein